MSSSPQFDITDKDVVYELASHLHSGVLDILGYGMYTGIYFIALYLTLSRSRIGSALLVSIMWILVTIHASIRWAQLDDIYLRNGETREAQLASLSLSRLDGFFSQSVTNATVTLVSLLLADLTMVRMSTLRFSIQQIVPQIWRCWVLHGRRWLVVVIPGLSLVSGAACYIWRTVIIFFADSFWTTDQIANLELLFLSTTVLTNIYCTTSIIYRVIGVDGWRKSLKTYRRLTEILVESSVLYTAIYVMRIGLQIYTQYFTERVDERARFAQALAYSITGIAPTLVIARLAAGYGRPDDSWTRASLPHMPTTMRSLTESLRFRRSNTSMDTADLERSATNSTLEDESTRLLVV